MKCLKRIILLAILIFTLAGVCNVQAANYICGAWENEEGHTRTARVDLNKDGKAETIKAVCTSSEAELDIYINNKKVLKGIYEIWAMDIDKKDKYIDIVATDKEGVRLHIYRYNGKNLVRYASANGSDITKIAKKNRIYFADEQCLHNIKTSGNGTITVYTQVYVDAFASDGYIQAGFTYNVRKNSIKLNQSQFCTAYSDWWDGKKYVTCKIKKNKKWKILKYQNMSSRNKVLTTAKKGDRVKIMGFKITDKFAYMKITKLSNKKTGWVVVTLKDIQKKSY